ncbi:MAG: hypothetical protein Unbinned1322contig1000_49 [Prokaryotic dsDNA virus sp.]|nr:hypothetical protein [Aequorivita sp.]QDP57305.1 MAG: hypothetical protein Unbinned1322contig1000_49 [Prokaryotic dsDNA virus sp.]|tara:strand:- start:27756 stop:29855 length:2100 start_codon:yes stop_codon:yes gene_type:complete
MKKYINFLILLVLLTFTAEARVFNSTEEITLSPAAGHGLNIDATSVSASEVLKLDGSKNLTSGLIDLASEVTGILPSSSVSGGGTADGINTSTNTVYTSGSAAPTLGQVLTATSAVSASWQTPLALGGDVTGPGVAADDNVVFFDGTTGKLIKDSGLTLSGSNTGDQTSVSGNSGSTDSLTTTTTSVVVSGSAAPTLGQVLTATSGSAATWQTPSGGGGDGTANALNTSTNSVYTSGSAAPTAGQVLQATSATEAEWANIGGVINTTDWIAFTPVTQGIGTISSVEMYYKRLGDSYMIRGSLVTGVASAVEAQIGLPNGESVKTGTVSSSAGTWFRAINGTGANGGSLIATAGDSFLNLSDPQVFGTASINPLNAVLGSVAVTASNKITINAIVPIEGLTSFGGIFDTANALSTSTNAVYVSGSAAPTAGQVLTATSSTEATWQSIVEGLGSSLIVSGNAGTSTVAYVTNVPFTVEAKDEENAWDGLTYTVPRNGVYSFTGSLNTTTALSYDIFLYIGGTQIRRIERQRSANVIMDFSFTEEFSAGDVVSLRLDSAVTFNNSSSHHMHIQELGGKAKGARVVGSGDAANTVNTALVTNILFTEVDDTGSNWNGTQFTAPRSGNYIVTGSTQATATVNNNIYLYVDASQVRVVGKGTTTDVIREFTFQEYLNAGEVLTLRTDVGFTTANTVNHRISIQEF